MTIPTGETSITRHSGNGVATVFDYEFKITDEVDLLVTQANSSGVETVLVLGTDYTVAGVGDNTGGSITLTTAPPSGEILAIEDDVDVSQLTPYGDQGAFFSRLHETSYDKNLRVARKALTQAARSLKVSASTINFDSTLPDPSAGLFLKWKGDLSGMENSGAPSISTNTVEFGVVSDMVASTSLGVGDLVQTAGYTTKGDGGDNLYEIVAASTGTDDGGSYIDLVTHQAKGLFPGGRHTVEQFGADPTGVLESGPKFIKAMAHAESRGNGAEVFATGLRYKISVVLRANKGIYLRGGGYGDVTTSSSNIMSTSLSGTTLSWAGGSSSVVYFMSDAADETLHGGGITGFLIDGNGVADRCIRVSSCRETIIDVATYRPVVTAIKLDDANGRLCDSVHIPRLVARIGSGVASAGADGIQIIGDIATTGFGCTNHYMGDIDIEHDTGHGIIFEDCDSCYVAKFKGALRGAATGYGLYFKNGGSGFPAQKNVIAHVARGGRIVAESATIANRLLYVNSEGTSIDHGGFLGALAYDVADRTHGDIFEGQTRYPMYEEIELSASELRAGTNATEVLTSLGFPVINLPNASTSFLSFNVFDRLKWNNGTITGVELIMTPSVGAGASNMRYTLDMTAVALDVAGGIGAVEKTASVTVASPTGINTATLIDIPLGGGNNIDFNRGESLFVKVSRIGADALDTSNQDCWVLGMKILYNCDGPDSQAATWEIPPNQLA